MTSAEQSLWEHFRKLVEARRSDQQFADSVTARIITAMFAAGDAAIASLTAERDALHRVIKGETTRASDGTGLTAAIDDAGAPVLGNGGRFLTAPERITAIAAKFNAAVAEARDWEERANFNRARELEQAARADEAEAECALWRREADAAAHAGLRAQERADKAEADAERGWTEARAWIQWRNEAREHLAAMEAGYFMALDSERDAGRALLAERDRLREENAALREQIEAVDHECKRQLETDRYKAALGRTHAALKAIIVPAKALQIARGDQWAPATHDAFVEAEKLALAVIADHEGRAAGEYVAALEVEHEAYKHLYVNGVQDPHAKLRNAHAAVESLRTVKP